MGVISRFADIMSANVNSVISQAESKNADKLLEKYLQDAKGDLARVKAETAAVIAEEMAAGRRLTECDSQISKYEQYAMAAVKASNDDDARKFLSYKGELSAKRDGLYQDFLSAKDSSEKMRQMSTKLAEDVRESESRLHELQSKLTIAKAQEKRNSLSSQLGGGMNDFDGLFEKVQKRIDSAEAAATLSTNSNSEMRDLEKKYGEVSATASSVDNELARLKSSMNG